MTVTGGRVFPTTIVVSPNTQLAFKNFDPFKHRIYVDRTGRRLVQGRRPASRTQVRTGPPSGAGRYEVRDELFPSVRTFVVVDPQVVQVAYPGRDGAFGLLASRRRLRAQGVLQRQAGRQADQRSPRRRRGVVELKEPLNARRGDGRTEMMILSRIWYVILAHPARGGVLHRRRSRSVSTTAATQAAMEETLKADSQVVSWAMQVDARRRLDVLLLAAVDPGHREGDPGRERQGRRSRRRRRRRARKALRAFNDKLPADYKNDVLFIADREGRLVAQIGYDAGQRLPRVRARRLSGRLRRASRLPSRRHLGAGAEASRASSRVRSRTRSVSRRSAPSSGSAGSTRRFAKEIGKRTRTNIAFFALGQRVASAATHRGLRREARSRRSAAISKAVARGQGVQGERAHRRAPARPDDKGGVLFVRLPATRWELGGGLRGRAPEGRRSLGRLGFINGADDTDKKNVKLWLVGAIVFGAALFGILFSFLEHSMPMGEMRRAGREAEEGRDRRPPAPALPRRLSARSRRDINEGIQRVVEKGGGTARKPADLESILGPVPAQPSMSAFSFPLTRRLGAAADGAEHGRGAFNQPRGREPDRREQPLPRRAAAAGRAVASGRPSAARPASRPGTPGPGAGRTRGLAQPGRAAGIPAALAATSERWRCPVRRQARRSTRRSRPGAGSHSATVAASPARRRCGMQATAPAPFPLASRARKKLGKDEDEQTMVAQPSADLIAATGGHTAAADPAAEWHQVYEEFLRTKRECGEPTDGLTFEKFQQTLKKNRDALDAAAWLQAREVLGLRQGRPRLAQGHARPRLSPRVAAALRVRWHPRPARASLVPGTDGRCEPRCTCMDRTALHLEIRNALSVADELSRHEHCARRGRPRRAPLRAPQRAREISSATSVGRTTTRARPRPRSRRGRRARAPVARHPSRRRAPRRSARAPTSSRVDRARLASRSGPSLRRSRVPSKPVLGVAAARARRAAGRSLRPRLRARCRLLREREARSHDARARGRASRSVSGSADASIVTDHRLSAAKRAPDRAPRAPRLRGGPRPRSPRRFLLGYVKKDPLAALLHIGLGASRHR